MQGVLAFMRKRRSLLLFFLFLLLLGPLLLFWTAVVDCGNLCFSRSSAATAAPSACRPRRSVAFLKTHKCASSSVQNVLLRYGDRHNLSFVLPNKSNYLGHPKRFNHTMASGNGSRRFQILAHHARFEEAEMRRVLAPDVLFVTIVREPASLFESLYSYYDLKAKSGMSLDMLTRGRPLPARVLRRISRGYKGKLGLNQMSFDLGLSREQFNNATVVDEFLHGLDTSFDLVMVAERMNESLILLADLLCWDTDDVVMFRHNARESSFRRRLSPQQRDALRKLNAADTRLYKHFVKKFDERVAAFGADRMAALLQRLDQRTRHWYNRCVQSVTPMRETTKHRFWTNSKVLAFQAKEDTSEECRRLLMPELVFTDYLRKKQGESDSVPTTRPRKGISLTKVVKLAKVPS